MPHQGNITPSRFADVMTRGRSKAEEWGKTAMSYALELAMNRELGVYVPDKEGIWAIEHGNAWEPYAIEAYEAHRIASTEKVDKPIFHPDFPFVCGQPDLLVDSDGIAEVKCPANPLNHVRNMIDASQYADYKWQIQGYLWITGRKWVDFVSYGADFPNGYELSVHRFERDTEAIAELCERVIAFEAIVQGYCEQIKAKQAEATT